ncbi:MULTISPECIES: hypothetical protein [Nocardioides]|uniref:Uncharacterized protein n=1 Tax=Nocardioides vastitatis TaxID=2568655 RepID=A0ABW0ZP73_9ACTN|nr:hypothetical protein [Nocardioides sp.]THI94393.1 hypothetical protein E7Z54_20145 [Nocardioides sp.]
MPAAFVAQALGSLLAWLLVNDESPEGGAWSNTDFGQWLAVSLLCTTLVGGVSGVASRRWVVAVAVAAG